MEKRRSSNAKVIWYILFAFITVIMCYLSIVVYFSYISPYNISLRTGLWPFFSDQAIGEMYLDATVEINFVVNDEISFEEIEKSVVGVNVRKDGYVVAPYNEFRSCSEQTQITILANSGKVYSGKLLYGDENCNLVILKCENVAGNSGVIKIPYVSLSSGSSLASETDVLAISSPMKSKTVYSGTIADTTLTDVYKEIEIENKLAVDFVLENCYTVMLETEDTPFEGGAVFDKSGIILGLSFEDTLQDGSYVIMPIDATKLFLGKVVSAYKNQKAYENKLALDLVGFDQIELSCFMITSNENLGNEELFYFNKTWQVYTDEIVYFSNSMKAGYYLFEDWVYDEETILSANNIVVSVSFNGSVLSTDTRTDFVKALYKMKTGDYVTVRYYEINTLGTHIKSVRFTV